MGVCCEVLIGSMLLRWCGYQHGTYQLVLELRCGHPKQLTWTLQCFRYVTSCSLKVWSPHWVPHFCTWVSTAVKRQFPSQDTSLTIKPLCLASRLRVAMSWMVCWLASVSIPGGFGVSESVAHKCTCTYFNMSNRKAWCTVGRCD